MVSKLARLIFGRDDTNASEDRPADLEGQLYCASPQCDAPLSEGVVYLDTQHGVVYHHVNERGEDCAQIAMAYRAVEHGEPVNATFSPLSVEEAYHLAQVGDLANRYERD